MLMKVILELYKEYYPSYNVRHKILSLYGKIPVREFVALKELLKSVREEVKDIRVNI